MPDLAEQIIELRISYDRAAVEEAFPRFPGVSFGICVSGVDDEPEEMGEPPIESVEMLVGHIVGLIRSASLTDPALRVCEVDVLTVDHRTPTPPTAASELNRF